MRKKRKLPEEGELIIATVTNIKPYGAYVTLDEYNHIEGMIHISEISTTWVKNIRDHVREGQKVVAKVLRVIPEKGQIDLSMRRVTKQQKILKIQSWKREQKARKIIEIALERANMPTDKVDEICWTLQKKYGEVYLAFETAVEKGEKILIDAGLDKNLAKEIYNIIKTQVKIPKVEISGTIILQSTASNGVELIKQALLNSKNAFHKKDVEIKMYTVGAPRYKVEVIAGDYRTAEEALKKITTQIESFSRENGLIFSFKREK